MSYYSLPKDLIKKGSDIIIYGCGEVGRFLIKRAEEEQYCNIIAIIDQNQKGVKYKSIQIIAPYDIYQYDFDYILIGSVDYEKEMLDVLLKLNVEKRKIVTLSERYRIIQDRSNIPYMEIDKEENSFVENLGEYVRYRCLELVSKEIVRAGIEGDIAEAGVYMGNFAKALNLLFPDRNLFLYDTFSGFSVEDIEMDIDNGYTSKERFANRKGKEIFKREDMSSDEQIEFIKRKLYKTGNVYFRKGNFPDTAVDEKNNCFALVSLDVDLYRPTKDGLQFFWPRMSSGGYIFLHDYNGIEHHGVKRAVEELEMQYGRITKVPLPDQYGTILLVKG